MNKTMIFLFLLPAYMSLGAARHVMDISWREQMRENPDRRTALLDKYDDIDCEDGCLRVRCLDPAGLRTRLLVVNSPGVVESRYALVGRVTFQDVSGTAYLEMWSHFSDGRYFTRTLAAEGPMSAFSGDSHWRRVVLPFTAAPESRGPAKIVLNLVLPGRGEVVLGPMELVEYAAGEPFDLSGKTGAWWNSATGGLIGGISGGVMGLFGMIAGWLILRGRGRRLVVNGLLVMTAAGAVVMVTGIIAWILDQPFAVGFPLMLAGGLALVLGFTSRLMAIRSYRNLELRRIQALDER